MNTAHLATKPPTRYFGFFGAFNTWGVPQDRWFVSFMVRIPSRSGGFLKWWYPKMDDLSWKTPIKVDDDWGYPYFRKPPNWRNREFPSILGTDHIVVMFCFMAVDEMTMPCEFGRNSMC